MTPNGARARELGNTLSLLSASTANICKQHQHCQTLLQTSILWNLLQNFMKFSLWHSLSRPQLDLRWALMPWNDKPVAYICLPQNPSPLCILWTTSHKCKDTSLGLAEEKYMNHKKVSTLQTSTRLLFVQCRFHVGRVGISNFWVLDMSACMIL